jgi:hypothetical protein
MLRGPVVCRVEVLEGRFHAAWQHQLAVHGPQQASLFAACRASVGHLFLAALPYKLINDAAQFVGPLILNRLLSVVAAQAAAAAAASDGSNSSSSGTGVAGAVNGSDWWGGLAGWLATLGLNDPLGNGYSLSLLMFVGTLLGVLADNQVGTQSCFLFHCVPCSVVASPFSATVAQTALLDFQLFILCTCRQRYSHRCKGSQSGTASNTCPPTSCVLPPFPLPRQPGQSHLCVSLLGWLQHFQRVMRAGFRLKAILTAEVYRKVRCPTLQIIK